MKTKTQVTSLYTYKVIMLHFNDKPFTIKELCDKINETREGYQQSACGIMLAKLYNEDLLDKNTLGVYSLKIKPPAASRLMTYEETGKAVFKYIESLQVELRAVERENEKLYDQIQKHTILNKGKVLIPGLIE